MKSKIESFQYTGGKNGAGVFQKIISAMPRHRVYIEPFLGSGAVIRRKKPAERQIGNDLDPAIYQKWIDRNIGDHIPHLQIFNLPAIEILKDYTPAAFWDRRGQCDIQPQDVLIYLDPPYLASVRAGGSKRLYGCEMLEDAQHIELLQLIARLECRVMISGYQSKLYDDYLPAWRKIEIPTTNRAGASVIETVWLNFPKPFELHDYSFVGKDARARWNLTKQKRTVRGKLLRMTDEQRGAWLQTIDELRAEAAAAPVSASAAEAQTK